MTRKEARELAFILTYQAAVQKAGVEEMLLNYKDENSFSGKGTEFVSDLIFGVEQNREQIDGVIDRLSKGWNVDRLSKVAVSILRIALFEVLLYDATPDSVAINEAVELAKKFEGQETASFLNGVLSTAVKEKNGGAVS